MRKGIKASLLVTLSVLSLFSLSAQAARGDVKEFYQGQSIDDMVIQFMEANHLPGLSMAIVQAPYIPRVVGYGLADNASRRLVATNTVFDIGQMTNAFTAVAVMQLVEAGKIKLDDPVSTYVSNLPSTWQPITIRELMTHSAGLPNYTEAPGFDYNHAYKPEEIINLVKDKPLQFSPGTNVENSDTDFYLLGMVIEKASGTTYQDYIVKNQIERLHLQHTFFASTLKSVKNEVNNGSQPFLHNAFKHDAVYLNPIEPAVGYTEINGTLVQTKPNNESATFANAGLMSSAQDISLWDIGLAGDILLKDAKDREFLYNPIKLKNGKVIPANVGWQFPGRPAFMYIKGNVPGFTAFLNRFTAPSELICVTLLTNKDNVANFEILGRKIAAAYDDKLAAPAGAAWTLSRQSPYSVTETIDRLTAAIKQQGGTIFARINHGENAVGVGEKLNPMQVLVLGNPSKGTALLQAKNSIGLELPLRVLVWEDNAGAVWVSFTNPVELAKAYHVEGQDALLQQMKIGLSRVVEKATSAYHPDLIAYSATEDKAAMPKKS